MTRKRIFKTLVCAALAGTGVLAILAGCASDDSQKGKPPTTQQGFYLFGPPPEKSGVQLWADNCQRCHNMRPPQSFSAAQWDAVVHHMRLRADLTGDEQRKIAEFLKSSN